MNIALLGYGKMGQAVEHLARQDGHTISAIFDLRNPLTPHSDLQNTDVLIDFSAADAVLAHLKLAADFNIPIVEGTTGWYSELGNIHEIKGLTLLYSPNFSLGVFAFSKIAELAAQLFNKIGGYDAYIHEWHHSGKADSPSGTAKKLAEGLLAHLDTKTQIQTETSHGKIEPDALHVTSTRAGAIAGTHEIGFSSPYDWITLRHQAVSREGFAGGALRAARWLVNRTGIFTMDDLMNDLFQN
ncbi:MAG: 4-hydroxy-tetrahydrodipicolinate reductase [Calditrichaeota bacterium]|nr:4-hydroxy-tetrahydrodipicolinate reductase [Calditrichota bacterium]